jgi:hypothetical protein
MRRRICLPIRRQSGRKPQYTANGEHLFNMAQDEREAEIQPYGMADDFSGKAVALV